MRMKVYWLTTDELRNLADGVDNPKIDNKLEHNNMRVQELIGKVRIGFAVLKIRSQEELKERGPKMKKITLFVDKEKFVDWYFDENTVDSTIDVLIENGSVCLEDCLEDLGYIPLDIIVNTEDIRESDIVDNMEIEEPGRTYNLKFEE